MIWRIFAYKDKSIKCFTPPRFEKDDVEQFKEATIRGCLKLTTEEDKMMARDRALYYFGTFNDTEAKFDLLPEPEKLIDFEDYVRKEE